MHNNGVTEVDHYLDDFITVGPSGSDVCHKNLTIMLDACKKVGFAISKSPGKVAWPTPVLEIIGYVFDTIKMEICVSKERVQETVAELNKWLNRRLCSKRQLLSLIGKLIFIARVVRSGRTFVRRMINLSKKVKHLHHRIRLNRDFRDDVKWWLHYLPSWNGISFFYETNWSNNADLELYTDASDVGIGCYFKGAWIMQSFDNNNHKFAENSINWRELYAVVVAVATWGHMLASKKVLFHCDNMSIMYILKSGVSKDAKLMTLVRALFYMCAKHNIEISSVYVSSTDNGLADSLSRLDIDRFRILAPNADIDMTRPADIDYDIC